MEERRKEERFVATFPVAFETDAGWVFLTFSCNASRSGLLVMTADALEVGEAVTITYKPRGPEGPKEQASGTIVRIDDNSGPDKERWPYLAGVAFPEGIPEIEQLVAECAGPDEAG
jgi:hypothetical protein